MAWTPKTFRTEAPVPVATESQPSAWQPKSFQPEAAESSTLETIGHAGRGALQGLTMGFADELGGAGTAVLQGVTNLLPEKARTALDLVESGAGDAYTYSRDQARAADRAAKEESPWAYGAGEVAGSVLSPASKALAPLKAAKGASVAQRVGIAAGNAALQGGAMGLGSSEASGVGGNLEDAIIGGALGAGTGAALTRAGAALKAAPAALRGLAERRAVKAAGAIQSDISGMRPEQIQAMGRQALDEPGLIRFGDKAADIARRAKVARKEAGDAVGAALRQVDATGTPFDVDALAKRVGADLGARTKGNPIAQEDLRAVLKEARLNELDRRATFEAMHAIKRRIADGLFNRADPPARKRLAEQLVGVLTDEIDRQAEMAGGAGARSALEAAKARAGPLINLAKVGAKAQKRELGNRMLSPSDYITGAAGMAGSLAGAAAAGPLGAMTGPVMALAHKLVRERGSASVAVLADRLSKKLAAAPQSFGRYAPMLQRAGAQSPVALVALHQALRERDPDYPAEVEE